MTAVYVYIQYTRPMAEQVATTDDQPLTTDL